MGGLGHYSSCVSVYTEITVVVEMYSWIERLQLRPLCGEFYPPGFARDFEDHDDNVRFTSPCSFTGRLEHDGISGGESVNPGDFEME